jgi:hypothetical protein
MTIIVATVFGSKLEFIFYTRIIFYVFHSLLLIFFTFETRREYVYFTIYDIVCFLYRFFA